MIIDGKLLAEDIIMALEKERKTFHESPRLGIVLVGENAVTQSFVRVKEKVAARLGVVVVKDQLSEQATTKDAIGAVLRLAHDTNGLIVQLPLPEHVHTDDVLAAIPFDRDIDAVNATILETKRRVEAPIGLAILEIFSRTGVVVRGSKAVVIGSGRLVGKPARRVLTRLGAHVSVITQMSGSVEELRDADIIISGAGEPGLITPERIKKGVVIIDAGTSEASGKIAGDADPQCAEIASVFTPVPGGVGPVAVAMIFKNLFQLSQVPIPK